MEKRYQYAFPYARPLTANTLCIVGVCTCLLMKMAVERVFQTLGITDYNVEPATEDNPMGSRDCAPDVIFCEALRMDELRQRVPEALVIEVKDIADQERIRQEIIRAFLSKGWLREE